MLEEKLANDLRQVMKSGEKVRLDVIRQIRASIKNTQIAKQKKLDESEVLGVVYKEAKQRRESIEEFKKGNRQDLVAQEEAELAIIMEYLPKQISREEIVAIASRIIQEAGAKGPRDKGKVMPKIIEQLKGKAEGREINEIVTELLNN